MNTHSGREKFENFRIILDSRSSATIVIGKPTSKLRTKEAKKTTLEIQYGKFTNSKKVNVDFCLPNFIETKIVTWKCHVDNSTNGIYDMILGRDLLTALGLDPNFSKNVVLGEEGPY